MSVSVISAGFDGLPVHKPENFFKGTAIANTYLSSYTELFTRFIKDLMKAGAVLDGIWFGDDGNKSRLLLAYHPKEGCYEKVKAEHARITDVYACYVYNSEAYELQKPAATEEERQKRFVARFDSNLKQPVGKVPHEVKAKTTRIA